MRLRRVHYAVIPDGTGGAIVAWSDERTGTRNVYAQRLDANGALRWETGGAALSSATGVRDWPRAVADGTGGAIVVWIDERAGDCDVYAQRVSASGSPLWNAGGETLAAGPGHQRCPRAIPDGAGGAIVAWVNDTGAVSDIYAQHVDSLCGELWGPGYVPVCTAPGDQDDVAMIASCMGGAIVSWIDYRARPEGEIRAVHVNPSVAGDPGAVPVRNVVLAQNVPNPFNPSTTIEFSLASPAQVSLEIFDARGRFVRRLVDGKRGAGRHTVSWAGSNDRGAPVASGVYFYRLSAGERCETRKMVLLR